MQRLISSEWYSLIVRLGLVLAVGLLALVGAFKIEPVYPLGSAVVTIASVL